jgi:hypothetical protein
MDTAPAPTELRGLAQAFVATIVNGETEIYNEFSLQHEFGHFLRRHLPGYVVQFERNVEYFVPTKGGFSKREIDITVFSRDKTELRYAIELKFPRNGQYPEQMFSFCRDIAFAEQLKQAGFAATAVLIVVDHHGFYRGQGSSGIYAYFRGGMHVSGRIEKPTGRKDDFVEIKGSHRVTWVPMSGDLQYALIEV